MKLHALSVNGFLSGILNIELKRLIGFSTEALELLDQVDFDKYFSDPFIQMEILSIYLYVYSIQRNYESVNHYFEKIEYLFQDIFLPCV